MFENRKERESFDNGLYRNPAVGLETGIHTAVQLQKQRDKDQKMDRLRTEFQAIDRNHDGAVTFKELTDFLDERVGNVPL